MSTMTRKLLADCRAGDVLHEVLVVSNAQLAASATGKLYIKAFVSDRSGQMTARVWNASREQFERLPDSSFQRIRGRVENFQSHLQLIIEQFEPVEPDSVDLTELLPTTGKDIDAMCQRLFALIETLEHAPTRAIAQAFLDDEDLMNNFVRAPAASTFHHAFVGGLLEHTINMLEAAERLLPLYPGLSRDLVLAGIFLHDIAKTWELRYDAAFGYTDSGHLIGHVVKAAIWIEEKAAVASETLDEPIPREVIDALQHIVLAHHGAPEHGAARPPLTPEALFVHLLDNLDAKMAMALSATRRTSPGGASCVWTDYLRPFDNRFYAPDPTRRPPPHDSPLDTVVAPTVSEPPAGNKRPGQQLASQSTSQDELAHDLEVLARAGDPVGEKLSARSTEPADRGGDPTGEGLSQHKGAPMTQRPPVAPAPPAMQGPRVVRPANKPADGLPSLDNPLFERSGSRRR